MPKVILGINQNKKDMLKSLSKFSTALRKADVGLFFFAGHGIQLDYRNYLIPVGCSLEEESDVEFEGLDAGRVISRMESAGSRLNIVILDACRNNPFARSFRSSIQGLARMDAPKGTIIAYATSPGSVALDGKGRNGTFTMHLLSSLILPGLDIQDIFNQAGIKVMEETDNKQVPWVSNTPIPVYYLAGQPGRKKQNIDQQSFKKTIGSITVKPTPPDSLVRILNIAPKYKNGIKLKSGNYHIEVSANGYEQYREWINLEEGEDLILNIDLKKNKGNTESHKQRTYDKDTEICDLITQKIKYLESLYWTSVKFDKKLDFLLSGDQGVNYNPELEVEEINRCAIELEIINTKMERLNNFNEKAGNCYNYKIMEKLEEEVQAKIKTIQQRKNSLEDLRNKIKNYQSTSPPLGSFCCDIFGNRHCRLVQPLWIGSPCICFGQGQGIVCQ